MAMLAITDQIMARFRMVVRRYRRGRSALRRCLDRLSSEIPFSTIVLSIIRFSREIRIAMKAAIAPSKNAGAAACEMTCDN